MSNGALDVLTILDVAAEIEDRAALLYHNFSHRFRANPSGFSFWERISLEEKKHADMIRTYKRERLLIPVCKQSHPELLREMEQVRVVFLRQLQRPLDEGIATTLAIAHRLEGHMAHAHLNCIHEVVDPLLAKLFNKLGHEDRRHQERIFEMCQTFSSHH